MKFLVSCAECNRDAFKERYNEYITAEYPDYMDNVVFCMNATSALKKEIAKLQEECIHVLPTPTPDKIRYCAYLKNGVLIGTWMRLCEARESCYGINAVIKKITDRGWILKTY